MKKTAALLTAIRCVSLSAGEESAKCFDAPAGKSHVHKASAGKERVIEVFLPPNNDPAKAKVPGVILFHGGGWRGGTPAQFRGRCA